MSIRFACESCRRVYELPDEAAGRQAKCECGEMLVVPATSTYTGRMRSHAPAAANEAPSDLSPATPEPAASSQGVPNEPPPLPAEAFDFAPSPPAEPAAPPLAVPPRSATPTPPITLPELSADPPQAAASSFAASGQDNFGTPKRKYRHLRAYCVYMRYFSIVAAGLGTLWLFVQAYLFTQSIQKQGFNAVVAIGSLGSMLMTVFSTLACYVVLNATAEFFQVQMDIEENTRRGA